MKPQHYLALYQYITKHDIEQLQMARTLGYEHGAIINHLFTQGRSLKVKEAMKLHRTHKIPLHLLFDETDEIKIPSIIDKDLVGTTRRIINSYCDKFKVHLNEADYDTMFAEIYNMLEENRNTTESEVLVAWMANNKRGI